MSIGIFLVVLISRAFSLAPTSSATREQRLEIDEVRTEIWEVAACAVVLIPVCAGTSFHGASQTAPVTVSWPKSGRRSAGPGKSLM